MFSQKLMLNYHYNKYSKLAEFVCLVIKKQKKMNIKHTNNSSMTQLVWLNLIIYLFKNNHSEITVVLLWGIYSLYNPRKAWIILGWNSGSWGKKVKNFLGFLCGNRVCGWDIYETSVFRPKRERQKKKSLCKVW